jgi:uncharacterized protein YdeI (YjbR/CyaY-like superfamily)
MHAGRNVAIVGALRDDFRLSFFAGALLRDPERDVFWRTRPSQSRSGAELEKPTTR